MRRPRVGAFPAGAFPAGAFPAGASSTGASSAAAWGFPPSQDALVIGRFGGTSGARAATSPSETRFALAIVGFTLAGVYLISGLTLLPVLRNTGIVLISIGVLQAILSIAARTGRAPALAMIVVGNVLLVLVWLLSRTVGLSFLGGPPQPVGVLDALCAADSCLIVLLALTSRHGGVLRVTGINHVAILVSVLTAAAALGGHTHGTPGRGGVPGAGAASAHYHFYCRLL